jgi:hypothetical protein
VPNIIETIIALSTQPPLPARVAAREPLVHRANAVEAQVRRLRGRFYDMAEDLSLADTKVLSTKVTLAMFPLVASLVTNGRRLRDLLDADLLDLRDARRATRTALSGPEPAFVSSMQQFEKFVKLGESHVDTIGSTVVGVERALARLAGADFVSTALVIPPLSNAPSISTSNPTSVSA